jgi:hypothetical protein
MKAGRSLGRLSACRDRKGPAVLFRENIIKIPFYNLGAFPFFAPPAQRTLRAGNRAFRGSAYASFFALRAKNAPRPSNPLRENICGNYEHKTLSVKLRPFFLFVFLALAPHLPAQSSGRNSTQTVAPNILPDTQSSSEFPLWARDLRRAEIVAFGSFPFTLFVSTFAVDSMRYFQHGRDSKYLPWPLKGPGAVEMSREERQRTLLIAAAASVAIAAIDFTIVQVKRNRERERIERQNSGGTTHIIRSPIPEEEPEEENPEVGEPEEENPEAGEPEENP